ncbi:MAG: hypothetical protein KF687_16740 [Cyclobacteriaceae bacterium]|nr:hypothetical protein [Cyclobacteriaceae bacterium]
MEPTIPSTITAKQIFTFCFSVSAMLFSFASPAQDKWLGYYESPADKILLQVEPKVDGYFRGRMLYQGVIIPIKAFTLLGAMTGEYQRDGADLTFSLYRVGDVWTFTIDNQDYTLKKVSQAEFPAGAPVAVQVTKSSLPPVQQAATSNTAPVAATSTAASAEVIIPENFSTVIKDPGGTFTINIPDGWQSNVQDDVYVLTKAGETTEIRIDAHHYSDRQQLLTEGNGEEFEDIFNYIKITSQPYGTQHVRTTSQGKIKGRNVLIETLALYSPHGGGALIGAVIYDKNRVQEYFSLIEQIAQTVVFEKQVEDNTWLNRVRGKQLLYLKTISGGSTKYYYNLYSNGRYDYVYTYTYNSNSFYGSDNDRDQGTWKIVNRGNKAVLILNGNKKGMQEIILEQRTASNELTGNGERFFVKAIE